MISGNKMLIQGYSNFSLTKSGVLSTAYMGAFFELDQDVSHLFPYLNRHLPESRFLDIPRCIQFGFKDCQCSLYPGEVIAAPFTAENQAREFADSLVVFLNKIDEKKSGIEPDYKTFKPVAVLDIYKLLPGTNCKECGFSTCMAFAASVSQKKSRTGQCPYFTKPISEKAVYPVFDKKGRLLSTVSLEMDSRPVIQTSIQTELTNREIEVLCLVAEGATNSDISDQLFISPHTVKSHVINIFNKLGVSTRTQAAVWAAQKKIL